MTNEELLALSERFPNSIIVARFVGSKIVEVQVKSNDGDMLLFYYTKELEGA
jgi:hypothetical protein